MNWLSQTLAVGVGGFVGANLRFWVGAVVFSLVPKSFPWPTLTVNAIGCFAIGVVMSMIIRQGGNEPMRLFGVVGVLGGFTTMSAFSYEMLAFLRSNQGASATAYLLLSLSLCLGATWLGTAITQRI